MEEGLGASEELLLLSQNKKLSVKTKLAYGIGEFGFAAAGTIEGFFLESFLLEVAQVGAYNVSGKERISFIYVKFILGWNDYFDSKYMVWN